MTKLRQRRAEPSATGIDLPVRPQPRYGLEWPLVMLVATLLGLLSSALAWQLTRSMGSSPAHWPSLVVLNCSYWYVWALFINDFQNHLDWAIGGPEWAPRQGPP